MSETIIVKVQDAFELCYYSINGFYFESLEEFNEQTMQLTCRICFSAGSSALLGALQDKHRRREALVNLEALRQEWASIKWKLEKGMKRLREQREQEAYL